MGQVTVGIYSICAILYVFGSTNTSVDQPPICGSCHPRFPPRVGRRTGPSRRSGTTQIHDRTFGPPQKRPLCGSSAVHKSRGRGIFERVILPMIQTSVSLRYLWQALLWSSLTTSVQAFVGAVARPQYVPKVTDATSGTSITVCEHVACDQFDKDKANICDLPRVGRPSPQDCAGTR
jgi:hypothetical protein